MKFIWHENKDYKHLAPIKQVYGVCFDKKGKILILREPDKEWNIPGGKPELNETPIQTLKRELIEEVDVEIDKYGMIGYFEVLSENPTIYQLRFACVIKKINKQTPDQASNLLNERRFVMQSEFFGYVKIEDYRPMIDASIRWFQGNEIFFE